MVGVCTAIEDRSGRKSRLAAGHDHHAVNFIGQAASGGQDVPQPAASIAAAVRGSVFLEQRRGRWLGQQFVARLR
jgi:hypothetical protein